MSRVRTRLSRAKEGHQDCSGRLARKSIAKTVSCRARQGRISPTPKENSSTRGSSFLATFPPATRWALRSRRKSPPRSSPHPTGAARFPPHPVHVGGTKTRRSPPCSGICYGSQYNPRRFCCAPSSQPNGNNAVRRRRCPTSTTGKSSKTAKGGGRRRRRRRRNIELSLGGYFRVEPPQKETRTALFCRGSGAVSNGWRRTRRGGVVEALRPGVAPAGWAVDSMKKAWGSKAPRRPIFPGSLTRGKKSGSSSTTSMKTPP